VFGHFNAQALSAYAEKVKEKKVAATQGTEWADNRGVGDCDSSFLDNDESQDARDYAEFAGYDFGACVRGENQL
jgi:hypothetical protein